MKVEKKWRKCACGCGKQSDYEAVLECGKTVQLRQAPDCKSKVVKKYNYC